MASSIGSTRSEWAPKRDLSRLGSPYRVYVDQNPLSRWKREADRRSPTRLKAVLQTAFLHGLPPNQDLPPNFWGGVLRNYLKTA